MPDARQIEFLRDRHVHDAATCDADDTIEEDTVRCGQTATLMVQVNGLERFVCHHHLSLLCKERWPQVNTKG